jgi:hypothetical protein
MTRMLTTRRMYHEEDVLMTRRMYHDHVLMTRRM